MFFQVEKFSALVFWCPKGHFGPKKRYDWLKKAAKFSKYSGLIA